MNKAFVAKVGCRQRFALSVTGRSCRFNRLLLDGKRAFQVPLVQEGTCECVERSSKLHQLTVSTAYVNALLRAASCFRPVAERTAELRKCVQRLGDNARRSHVGALERAFEPKPTFGVVTVGIPEASQRPCELKRVLEVGRLNQPT
jgi:hypothetical protein